jgi:hypothetical protein
MLDCYTETLRLGVPSDLSLSKGSLVDANLFCSLFFPLTMNSLQRLSGKVPALMLLGTQLSAPLANVT